MEKAKSNLDCQIKKKTFAWFDWKTSNKFIEYIICSTIQQISVEIDKIIFRWTDCH